MNHHAFSHRTIQILLAFCLVSIPLGLSLFFPPPPLAHAATITVQSSADGSAIPGNCPGGGCRLRDAIAAANPAGGDTIDFNLTYPATITLTSGELLITKSLTINGPDAISLTISGGNATRVMEVFFGITVTLSGVTISNGKVNNLDGGGIYNYATLNIANSTFYSNTALGTGSGGALLNNGGTVTITSTNFYSNSASSGGGGGISNLGGTLTLVSSTFTLNRATSGIGGGILNNASALNITSGNFSGNSAWSAGGIFNIYGTLIVTNSLFFKNSATSGSGGGISNYFYSSVTLINSTFSGNDASGDGGGINNGGTLTITSSTLSENRALGQRGGGIANFGPMTMTNSTLAGNSAATWGGGVYNYLSVTLTITNSTLAGNSASGGGGIYDDGGATVLRNTIVANNIATSGGNCFGTIGDGGNNLQWNPNTGCVFALAPGNPKLAPLGNYGGPTKTMALFVTSDAINKVILSPSDCPATDQRGVVRPQGAFCDIGAFEGTWYPLYLPLVLR